jgi:hypothetical protein
MCNVVAPGKTGLIDLQAEVGQQCSSKDAQAIYSNDCSGVERCALVRHAERRLACDPEALTVVRVERRLAAARRGISTDWVVNRQRQKVIQDPSARGSLRTVRLKSRLQHRMCFRIGNLQIPFAWRRE